MDLQLKGKTALVSGSTKGIGYAIARALAKEAATVIINGRSQDSVETALASLKIEVPQGHIEGMAGDLSDATATEALIARYPAVDILVNNLGIFEATPFAEIADDDWERFFRVNVLSGVRLSRAYLEPMRHTNWGRILFISSESAIQIPAEMIHYGMTKTAQLAVSRGLAELCAGTGITVNAVLPGPTRSAGLDDWAQSARGDKPFEEFEKAFVKSARPTSLLRRFASTDEVAHLDGGVVKSCF
jgi:NAD(P)-dependent dehydrogenase (short-subunit alcohol dehydrogenase family)